MLAGRTTATPVSTEPLHVKDPWRQMHIDLSYRDGTGNYPKRVQNKERESDFHREEKRSHLQEDSGKLQCPHLPREK